MNRNIPSRRSWFGAFLVGTVGLTGLTGVVRAEEPVDAPRHAKEGKERPVGVDAPRPGVALERIKQFASELDLSPEQTEKLKPVLEQARVKGKQLMLDAQTMEPRERIMKLADFLADTREQVKDILTDEQKVKFEAKLSEVRNRMSEGAGEAGVGGRVKDALAKLDLSSEQKERVDAILEETKTRMMEIRMDAAEKSKEAMDDAREHGKQVMQETREKIAAVLTPDQRTKLRELMQGEGRPGAAKLERKPVNASPASKADR